jgi:hypothetical protein
MKPRVYIITDALGRVLRVFSNPEQVDVSQLQNYTPEFVDEFARDYLTKDGIVQEPNIKPRDPEFRRMCVNPTTEILNATATLILREDAERKVKNLTDAIKETPTANESV